MRRPRIVLPILFAIVLAMAAAPATSAGAGGTHRPFDAHLTGVSYWPGQNPLGCGAPFFETTFGALDGQATHLGRVHVTTLHCPAATTADGFITIEAANGDVLRGTYVLTIVSMTPDMIGPIVATLDITIDPSTSSGRFAGATGHADADLDIEGQGLSDPEWPMSWTWDGWLSY